MVNKKSKNIRKKTYKISVIDYGGGHFQEMKTNNLNDCFSYRQTETVTWINVDKVPPSNYLKDLELGFDLHPVVLEDIMNANQRPKIEVLEDYIYIVLKMLSLDKTQKNIVLEQVSMIIAPKFVITFQQGIEGDVFEPVRKILHNEKTKIRILGTDYLAYELVDAVVENYFKILGSIGESITKLEEKITTTPGGRTLKSVHRVKSQIIDIKKNIAPLKEVINVLLRGDSLLIKKNTRIYIRDIYDRLIQVMDTMTSYQDMLSGMEDLYISTTSNKTNSIMKILTIITTVFMPLSFLAGVYGMNFRYMPGLNSHWGFPTIIVLMGIVFFIMIMYFKKKDWL